MKKLIITSLAICFVFFGFAFLILFEANINRTLEWWASYSRDSQTLPYSPYKIRREDSAYLRIDDANEVKFIDKHLFWKGEGAVALPEITKSGKLVRLIIKSGGTGYSNDVEAIVSGSMGNSFILGNVKVVEGEIKVLILLKLLVGSFTPKAFWGDESLPFSGTIEKVISHQTNYVSKTISCLEDFMANGKDLQKLEFQYFLRIIFMGVKARNSYLLV